MRVGVVLTAIFLFGWVCGFVSNKDGSVLEFLQKHGRAITGHDGKHYLILEAK